MDGTGILQECETGQHKTRKEYLEKNAAGGKQSLRNIKERQMKEWTREEVERLVPESNTEHWERNMSCGYPAVLWDALLQTRLDLETARDALERIIKKDTGLNPHIRCNEMANIAREALKGYDK